MGARALGGVGAGVLGDGGAVVVVEGVGGAAGGVDVDRVDQPVEGLGRRVRADGSDVDEEGGEELMSALRSDLWQVRSTHAGVVRERVRASVGVDKERGEGAGLLGGEVGADVPVGVAELAGEEALGLEVGAADEVDKAGV